MGRVSVCYGTLGPDKGEVKAMLEGHVIQLRGDFKADLPLEGLSEVRVQDGALVAHTKQGPLSLALGDGEAALWAKKILHPPSLIDKLGVRPETAVHVHRGHPEVKRALDPAGAPMVPLAKAQLAFIVVETEGDLAAFKSLAKARPDGCQVWVLRRKGAAAQVPEREIMAAAKAEGLGPSKTAAWSDIYAADRYGRARR